MSKRSGSLADLRVMGNDPGKHNFGWAIYDRDGLETSGVIEGADSIKRLAGFRDRFSRLLDKHDPNAVCIERFTRRFGKGAAKDLEIFNLIIGIAIGECMARKIPCYPVTASAHKGWIAKNFEVKQHTGKSTGRIQKKWDITTYKEWKELPTEHEVDAANLAKYGYEYLIPEKEEQYVLKSNK